MSEQASTPAARFCLRCGQPTVKGANYCAFCGAPLRTAPAERSGQAQTGLPAVGYAVLVGFLGVGLVLWTWILRPHEPVRQALAPKAGSAAASGSPSGLPPDHPPVAIPEEVKAFLEDLEEKALAAPKDLETWQRLAQVQYRAGQVDKNYLPKSEAAFRHVLELDPNNLEALRGLGNVYFDRDEYDRATEYYRAYLKQRPDDASVRTDLGTMLLYGGRLDEAVREYQAVVEREPGFYQAHFNLGIALLRRGDPEGARKAFEKARETAPDATTRDRIQAMIDRSRLPSPGPPGANLAERIERSLRSHPVAGPKVVRLEWSSPTEGRAILDAFPLEAMPEFARAKFLGRLREELAEAREATATRESVRLDLVDLSSNRVMATVVAP